jgi:hypothetical protein
MTVSASLTIVYRPFLPSLRVGAAKREVLRRYGILRLTIMCAKNARSVDETH